MTPKLGLPGRRRQTMGFPVVDHGGKVTFNRSEFAGAQVTFDRAKVPGGGVVTRDGAEFRGWPPSTT
jgi:hypothetical protein